MKKLDLSWSKVTDAGLVHLEGSPSLEKLDLRKIEVTGAGGKQLQAALPDCQVRWY